MGVSKQQSQAFNMGLDVAPQNASKAFDDDGRVKRTGTMWTASSHIITAVIGSGVLSLAWATAQLGWIAGPIVMILFSIVTYYTSVLLSDCYRSGDPVSGKRNYTYMDAVQANLGGLQVKICGLIQYLNLFGVAIGYTIAASISMTAIKRSNCFHEKGEKSKCDISANPYMILFGVAEIFFSQIPDFDQIWWLSIVAAVMSFTYSTIGLGLGIAKVAVNGKIKGSLTGISVGVVTETDKVWRSFQALGDIAFAYSYSMILIEIQDTVRSPPAESKTMRKATLISVVVTTVFYLLCGCFGYAAFGDLSPGNLLTGFGFYNPFWLVDIANAAIVIHLVGAYQVYCQPLYAFIEKIASETFPDSDFITKDIKIPLPGGYKPYNLNLFRLVWRTVFVIITTVISMLLPFFNDVVGLLGALGFWPLTVYFPVEMYISQKKIPKWTTKWISLQILSAACLIISIAAAAGSIAGVVNDLKTYKPFKTTY
ncbi:amino acid permease 3-like [Chenopodium quinoa]|uniref:Amino acid transporter transmembrane domain-containing protein n=1 Tax=Chenopodium quinoa TaxID=63459 RepID=A0A803N9B0_CHEQI|nr:amino acid permease 3-like [Chenopodium quinoa]